MRLTFSIILWFFALTFPSLAADFGDRLAVAALERTQHTVRYDGRYQRLSYPGGDVPDDQGVCTDVVIRAYRALGVDLQVLVHEDMAANFADYPMLWGLKRPDPNIDHRRVPNLQVFFGRQGASVSKTSGPAIMAVGDVLTWMLPGNLPHTGIVVTPASASRPMQVVHNYGAGPQKTTIPDDWVQTGHYRFSVDQDGS